MNKSHVSMEQKVCLVCGTTYDTNALLLDKRLRETLERHTVTGWGLCPEHEKLHKDGFVALVEATGDVLGESLKPEQANRTGNIAHVRRTLVAKIFDTDFGDRPMVFVEPGVIQKIEAMMEKPDDD